MDSRVPPDAPRWPAGAPQRRGLRRDGNFSWAGASAIYIDWYSLGQPGQPASAKVPRPHAHPARHAVPTGMPGPTGASLGSRPRSRRHRSRAARGHGVDDRCRLARSSALDWTADEFHRRPPRCEAFRSTCFRTCRTRRVPRPGLSAAGPSIPCSAGSWRVRRRAPARVPQRGRACGQPRPFAGQVCPTCLRRTARRRTSSGSRLQSAPSTPCSDVTCSTVRLASLRSARRNAASSSSSGWPISASAS